MVKFISEQNGHPGRCAEIRPTNEYNAELATNSSDADDGIALFIGSSLSIYWIWVGVNAAMVLGGYAWFRMELRNEKIGLTFTSLGSINKEPHNFQVDYAMVQSRVDSAMDLLEQQHDEAHGKATDVHDKNGEVVIEFDDPDLELHFYEPTSPYGHVLKRIVQGAKVIQNRTWERGQRLIAVQNRTVVGIELDVVKEWLAAAKGGKLRLTFSPAEHYRVVSHSFIYKTVDGCVYSGGQNDSLQLQPIILQHDPLQLHQLKLQKRICAIGRHDGESSLVGIGESSFTQPEQTTGCVYIRIDRATAQAQIPDGDRERTTYWVCLHDARYKEMYILRKEQVDDFAIELHLYEDTDFTNSGETHRSVDSHQHLEKPALEYVLNRNVPVKIQSLDVANELKNRDNVYSMSDEKESMQHWHDDLTNAPSGHVLIESLLHRHTVAEMKQRQGCCRYKRRSSHRLPGLTHEYEFQALCCVFSFRC